MSASSAARPLVPRRIETERCREEHGEGGLVSDTVVLREGSTRYHEPCPVEVAEVARVRGLEPPQTWTTTERTVQVPFDGELWRGRTTERIELVSDGADQLVVLDTVHEQACRFGLDGANAFYLEREEAKLVEKAEADWYSAHLEALRERIGADVGSLPETWRAEERAWREWLYAEGPAPVRQRESRSRGLLFSGVRGAASSATRARGPAALRPKPGPASPGRRSRDTARCRPLRLASLC